jgi:hypothetical protein
VIARAALVGGATLAEWQHLKLAIALHVAGIPEEKIQTLHKAIEDGK